MWMGMTVLDIVDWILWSMRDIHIISPIFFNVLENKDLYVDYAWLISNEEAFKTALGGDNIELCRLIDSFKVGLSNIKENKRMMLDKKENLLKTNKGN